MKRTEGVKGPSTTCTPLKRYVVRVVTGQNKLLSSGGQVLDSNFDALVLKHRALRGWHLNDDMRTTSRQLCDILGRQRLEEKRFRRLTIAGVVVSTAPTGSTSPLHRDFHGID